MYHKRKTRAYIAWVLFMTFIPFFVVKTFHYHGSEMKSHVLMPGILTNHPMIVRYANTPFLSLLNLNR